MIKAIGYAYPSSAIAARLNAADSGCWYIVTYDETDRTEDDLIGPFATIEAAEDRAANVAGRWSRYTKRAA